MTQFGTLAERLRIGARIDEWTVPNAGVKVRVLTLLETVGCANNAPRREGENKFLGWMKWSKCEITPCDLGFRTKKKNKRSTNLTLEHDDIGSLDRLCRPPGKGVYGYCRHERHWYENSKMKLHGTVV